MAYPQQKFVARPKPRPKMFGVLAPRPLTSKPQISPAMMASLQRPLVNPIPIRPAAFGLFKPRPLATPGNPFGFTGGARSLGDDAGVGNWITDILNVGPKIYVPGVTQPPPLTHYNAWRDAVLKRGNTPARMPSGPNAGKWAERYIDQFGTARFANAPQTVWDEDVTVTTFQTATADLVAAPGKILSGVAALPRQVIGSALGIPQWLMPVLLLGGAAIVVRQYLPKR